MIEISQAGDRNFFVLRWRGAQPRLDIIAVASELAQFQTDDASLKVLFDWLELESWPFKAPTMAAIEKWKKTVPSISRAAIVHDMKWNRHAALLAALLRVRNAQVCSFRPPDFNRAVSWIEKSRQFSALN